MTPRTLADEARAFTLVLQALPGITPEQLWKMEGPLSKCALETQGFTLERFRKWIVLSECVAVAQHETHGVSYPMLQVAGLVARRVALYELQHDGCTLEEAADQTIEKARVGRPITGSTERPRFTPAPVRLPVAARNVSPRPSIVARIRSSLSGRRRPGVTRTTRTGGLAAAGAASPSADEPGPPSPEERYDPASGVPFKLWQLEAAFELAATQRASANAQERLAVARANVVVLQLLQAGLLEAWIADVLNDGGES